MLCIFHRIPRPDTPYPHCQLHVFRHQCYSASVYCCQMAVLNQRNEVGLRRLVYGLKSRGCPTVRWDLNLLCHFPHKSSHSPFGDEEHRRRLKFLYFPEGHSPRPPAFFVREVIRTSVLSLFAITGLTLGLAIATTFLLSFIPPWQVAAGGCRGSRWLLALTCRVTMWLLCLTWHVGRWLLALTCRVTMWLLCLTCRVLCLTCRVARWLINCSVKRNTINNFFLNI